MALKGYPFYFHAEGTYIYGAAGPMWSRWLCVMDDCKG